MKYGAKITNTYDRIRSELEARSAIPPGNKHAETAWEIVPTTKGELIESLNKVPSQASFASRRSGPYSNHRSTTNDLKSHATSYAYLPPE